jgi:hypothetical protein
LRIISGVDKWVQAWDKWATEVFWANLAFKLPKSLVYWALIRSWAEYEPEFDWDSKETAPMWLVVKQLTENRNDRR